MRQAFCDKVNVLIGLHQSKDVVSIEHLRKLLHTGKGPAAAGSAAGIDGMSLSLASIQAHLILVTDEFNIAWSFDRERMETLTSASRTKLRERLGSLKADVKARFTPEQPQPQDEDDDEPPDEDDNETSTEPASRWTKLARATRRMSWVASQRLSAAGRRLSNRFGMGGGLSSGDTANPNDEDADAARDLAVTVHRLCHDVLLEDPAGAQRISAIRLRAFASGMDTAARDAGEHAVMKIAAATRALVRLSELQPTSTAQEIARYLSSMLSAADQRGITHELNEILYHEEGVDGLRVQVTELSEELEAEGKARAKAEQLRTADDASYRARLARARSGRPSPGVVVAPVGGGDLPASDDDHLAE